MFFFSVNKNTIYFLSVENERGKDDVHSLYLEVTASLQINNLNLSEVESEASYMSCLCSSLYLGQISKHMMYLTVSRTVRSKGWCVQTLIEMTTLSCKGCARLCFDHESESMCFAISHTDAS